MAKSRQQSTRSRAARRAASPSLDLDKSVTSLPRAESPAAQRASVLTDRRNSGIQKKNKNDKKLSKAQRLRQQKGMDRAEAVLDQMEIKKAKSMARGRAVNTRRADWEDTNRTASAFAALQQGENDDDDEDEAEDGDEAMAEDTAPPAKAVASTNVFQMTEEASAPATDDFDEIT